MASWHGVLFSEFDYFWRNLREFSYRNRTIFEVSFIIVYTLEQALLVWLTFTATNLEELGLIVSLFALIVLTTFTFHKLVMESRIGLLEKEINTLHQDKNYLEGKMKQMKEVGEEMIERWAENLNTTEKYSIKKRETNER